MMYETLFEAIGPQHWWPADTAFEVAVGAIMTQNTSWINVERAIRNLKAAGGMGPRELHEMPIHKLASLIRPAGYFNVKARRLKSFIAFLMSSYRGSMERMKHEDTGLLRDKLLSVHGIGPETADSILLYALEKPIFVIDAYTKRILSRHHIMDQRKAYGDFQALFHAALEKDTQLFNEYHALFVAAGKTYCKRKPRCEACPLKMFLPSTEKR